MNNQQAYNTWSATYDSMQNKTRDIEAKALRASLSFIENLDILEIGCGTGKNTEWLISRANHLVGADFSAKMLAKAKEKITAENVEFKHLDLREKWDFAEKSFDLIVCSLALEHIENIDFVFGEANKVLRENGLFYIGELHPFKQYMGSKAKFDNGSGVFELECFIHNISEFFEAGRKNNFECVELKEWFDDAGKTSVPRLLTMIYEKKNISETV
ncbi:MAG TPA: methyltransferase domain-containing protein [Pyrinomonadaceae bacterium]|jgi:ubiquinone/menaquinone biosynthesis C-methylase UbiE